MLQSKVSIKIISPETTHQVRHPVLRPGLDRKSCILTADEAESTVHLGAYENGTLLGVCTVLDNPSGTQFKLSNGQIRGMAVLQSTQRKGIGQLLIQEAESIGKKKEFAIMWMNARLYAVPFYEKFKYKIKGAQFEVPVFGPHYMMIKELL